MGRASGRMHIGRIEHHAVNAIVCIRQMAAVYTRLNISRQDLIMLWRDVPPKCSLTICHIRYLAAQRNVKPENLWEHFPIAICVGGHHKIIGGFPIADNSGGRHSTQVLFVIYLVQIPKLLTVLG